MSVRQFSHVPFPSATRWRELQRPFPGLALLMLVGTLAGSVGWFSNLWKLAQLHDAGWMVVLRIAGIPLVPLGALLGFF